MTPETRRDLSRIAAEINCIVATEPVEIPRRHEHAPMQPRRVWPESLPDCWRGGLASGDALIARAVSEPRWFERIVESLTEPLPEARTDLDRIRREAARRDRAIAVRLLQAFFDRELMEVSA